MAKAKSASSPRFHFIAGADDFLVDRAGKEVWAALSKGVDDWEVIDGRTGNVAETEEVMSRFISAVRTLPMFGGGKAVWFRHIAFMADTLTGRSEGAKAQVDLLIETLENVRPEEVGVLLTASPVDRRRKTYKWLQSHSDYKFLESGGDNEAAIQSIREEAGKAGLGMDHEMAQILLERVGGNLRMAMEETRKLAIYLGDGTPLTGRTILELVPPFGEGDFFEAVEAFFSGQLDWTLSAIHRHFFAGHDARPILAGLQNRARLALQIRALEVSGRVRGGISKRSLEDAASEWGHYFGEEPAKSALNIFTQNPWYLKRIQGSLPEKLGMKELIQLQDDLVAAFVGIIERPNEQESVVSELAIKTLA